MININQTAQYCEFQQTNLERKSIYEIKNIQCN